MKSRETDKQPRRLLETGHLAPLLHEYLKQTAVVPKELQVQRPWPKLARAAVTAIAIVWGIRWLPQRTPEPSYLCRETGTGGHGCLSGAKGVEGASGSRRGIGGASGGNGA